VCLGKKPKLMNGQAVQDSWVYKSWSDVMLELNIKRVSLLKMDIEASEFQALSDFHEDQVRGWAGLWRGRGAVGGRGGRRGGRGEGGLAHLC
jgi:hypothetical protein